METAGGILIIFWWAAGQFCLEECVTLSISCHLYLFWQETFCLLLPRKHHDREKQLLLNEVRILKSMRNKHIVLWWKVSAKVLLPWCWGTFFFDFAPFGLEGCVSSLQDYFDYIYAREESHNKIVPHVNWKVWTTHFRRPFFLLLYCCSHTHRTFEPFSHENNKGKWLRNLLVSMISKK